MHASSPNSSTSSKIFLALTFFTVLVVFMVLTSLSNQRKVLLKTQAATISLAPSQKPTQPPSPTPTLTSTPTPTPTATPSPTQTPDAVSREAETVRIINEKRKAENPNAPAYQINDKLEAAAKRHSSNIGPTTACTHDGTDGSSPWSRASDAGYTNFASGEVVTCNMTTVQSAVDSWWASPAHHQILMDANNTEIGCGWWTNGQGFSWVTCVTGQGKK